MTAFTLNRIEDVASLASKCSTEQFLLRLGGPSVLVFPGRDQKRSRVIVTLLHGNEPSGLRAVQSLAQEQITPAVNCYVIVASTAAAATSPWFSHRMLPGQPDLNRCFSGRQDTAQHALASAILDEINHLNPEAVIDVHNTSGSGPGFCVSVSDSQKHQALASLFTRWMIVTDIRLGSLMEQFFDCPVITIEAGGAKDLLSDVTAYRGIKAVFENEAIDHLVQPVSRLYHPVRLELESTRTIAYLDGPDRATDVCLRTDIESLNFGLTPAGTHLGWIRENSLAAFCLDNQQFVTEDFFCVEEHCLYTRVPLRMFMVTTNADIACSDCLFYFIHESD